MENALASRVIERLTEENKRLKEENEALLRRIERLEMASHKRADR